MGFLEPLKSLAEMESWDFSDRRGTLRIPCEIPAKLEKSGTRVDIVDLGLRGLRLLIHGKVRKGSVVSLVGPGKAQSGAVACKVQWKKKHPKGFVVGVSLKSSLRELSESWLFEEVKAVGEEVLQTQQRRSGVRVICGTPAMIWSEPAKEDAILLDLGLGGALIEFAGDGLKKGTLFRLEFGPLEELARVVINCEVVVSYKRETPRYGIKFNTFFVGGVTDLERYLNHFFAAEEGEPEA